MGEAPGRQLDSHSHPHAGSPQGVSTACGELHRCDFERYRARIARYVPGSEYVPAQSWPSGTGLHAGRELAPHLLELLAGRHLLGEQRGLDAVEQALEPPHQLGLGDPQLGLGRASPTRTAGPGWPARRQVGRQRLAELGRPTARRCAFSRSRPASSSDAARTSSSSCLTIEPIRITLAGELTDSRRRSGGSSLRRGRRSRRARARISGCSGSDVGRAAGRTWALEPIGPGRDSTTGDGQGSLPRAMSRTSARVTPSRCRRICSPTSPQRASSTHWPSWSQAPSWWGRPKSPTRWGRRRPTRCRPG